MGLQHGSTPAADLQQRGNRRLITSRLRSGKCIQIPYVTGYQSVASDGVSLLLACTTVLYIKKKQKYKLYIYVYIYIIKMIKREKI